MRSSPVKVALNPTDQFLMRQMRKDRSHVKTEAETGGRGHKPRDPWSP